MKGRFLLLIMVSFLILSCKKDEQSCSDGIFNPEKEESTDCGGVCPPCNPNTDSNFSFLEVTINGDRIYFGEYGLTKNSKWELNFINDSINISLNLGSGDTLGERPIEALGSSGFYMGHSYPVLVDGKSVFSAINQEDSLLSAYFQAKFVSNNGTDTLFLTNGEFYEISW